MMLALSTQLYQPFALCTLRQQQLGTVKAHLCDLPDICDGTAL